ncbi:hypothetical protein NOVO_00510 [Rickettsiales bacterium Ac37b]|nr:hypothetical protein NOVO_00510 [Rickettsiales bacterium Ac37b]
MNMQCDAIDTYTGCDFILTYILEHNLHNLENLLPDQIKCKKWFESVKTDCKGNIYLYPYETVPPLDDESCIIHYMTENDWRYYKINQEYKDYVQSFSYLPVLTLGGIITLGIYYKCYSNQDIILRGESDTIDVAPAA